MPRHAKILGKESDHWDKTGKALRESVNENGEVNWANAFMADPGVTKCPVCQEYYWKEADLLECPDCETTWNPFDPYKE